MSQNAHKQTLRDPTSLRAQLEEHDRGFTRNEVAIMVFASAFAIAIIAAVFIATRPL